MPYRWLLLLLVVAMGSRALPAEPGHGSDWPQFQGPRGDGTSPIHQFRHHQGYLYGFAGQVQGASEQAASDSTLNLVCVELTTGKVMWQEPGFKVGVSLTLADGLLLVRSYQTLRLVEATPKEYQLRGEVKTHGVWKPTLNLLDFVQPVLSRGRLFVRTPQELICYEVAR